MDHFRTVSGDTAKELLAEADFREQDASGMTLLHVLIQSHSAEIARAAVQAGALVDAGGARTAAAATPVGSPLHAAVQRGSLQHVQVLLDVGASLSLVDSAGDTPLHLAARANDAGMVAALASHGAPTHATDRMQGTPLHAAASAGGHEACDALLECGADAAALDDRQRAPFQVVSSAARNRAALVSKLQRAAEAKGWKAPPPPDADVQLPPMPAGAEAAPAASEQAASPAASAAESAEGEGGGEEELDPAQLAALTVAALHEKIQSSLESGAIGGYEDIYRALDEPGAGWFEGHHLSTVCNEIDIPVDDSIIPTMMQLLAEPAGLQDPSAEGGITRITWDEFKVFCEQSRDAVQG